MIKWAVTGRLFPGFNMLMYAMVVPWLIIFSSYLYDEDMVRRQLKMIRGG